MSFFSLTLDQKLLLEALRNDQKYHTKCSIDSEEEEEEETMSTTIKKKKKKAQKVNQKNVLTCASARTS